MIEDNKTSEHIRNTLRNCPAIAVAFAFACAEKVSCYTSSLARAARKSAELAKKSHEQNDNLNTIEHAIDASRYALRAPIYDLSGGDESVSKNVQKRKAILKASEDAITWQIKQLDELLNVE